MSRSEYNRHDHWALIYSINEDNHVKIHQFSFYNFSVLNRIYYN